MTEIVILEATLVAGMEALAECRKQDMPDDEICVAVYLAMRAVEMIAETRKPRESVH